MELGLKRKRGESENDCAPKHKYQRNEFIHRAVVLRPLQFCDHAMYFKCDGVIRAILKINGVTISDIYPFDSYLRFLDDVLVDGILPDGLLHTELLYYSQVELILYTRGESFPNLEIIKSRCEHPHDSVFEQNIVVGFNGKYYDNALIYSGGSACIKIFRC